MKFEKYAVIMWKPYFDFILSDRVGDAPVYDSTQPFDPTQFVIIEGHHRSGASELMFERYLVIFILFFFFFFLFLFLKI